MEILNQIYQKTLVKPGLPGFWGGQFQPGLPGKPGNTRLTKHFWLGFLSRDLSYQTFVVNYNQAYLESLVKPGSTRLSILVDNCQKPGKSGSTRVYQADQAFNQTFGARELNTSWAVRVWSELSGRRNTTILSLETVRQFPKSILRFWISLTRTNLIIGSANSSSKFKLV